MRWHIKHGDILDEPTDVLICSANVFLNLSGGVGGALLLRYGTAMQDELHGLLKQRGTNFAQPGEVFSVSPTGVPYKAVLHAVAVDGFYQSSPQIVEAVAIQSLTLAASLGARRVALTALATGYGRLSLRNFAQGIAPLQRRDFSAIQDVVICVRHQTEADELASEIRALRNESDPSAHKTAPDGGTAVRGSGGG